MELRWGCALGGWRTLRAFSAGSVVNRWFRVSSETPLNNPHQACIEVHRRMRGCRTFWFANVRVLLFLCPQTLSLDSTLHSVSVEVRVSVNAAADREGAFMNSE